MGLSKKEALELTMGEYLDLFDAYKEIYNFETKKMIYVLPEKLSDVVSMSDMK